jgi:4'-phosphopantetheinyl transferase
VIDSNYQWLPPPAKLVLQDDIHVWQIELDLPSKLQQFIKLLSSDELARADRLRFQQHRQRFIVGRGSLRIILSRYLDIEPQELQFFYEPFGKPVLAENKSASQLSFNISHSQGMALCACCHQTVGIDLEYIRPITDILLLAQRFFSPNEYDVIKSFPLHQQELFFRYWTCKEAYLKATGEGISQLQQVEVSLSTNTPATLDIAGWSLVELVPADNFVAAVAIPAKLGNIKYWQF